jgi:hypothetical protein
MQQQNVITLLDLIDLAHSLRQEQLFINNEQHIFARLNDSLNIDSRNVFQVNSTLTHFSALPFLLLKNFSAILDLCATTSKFIQLNCFQSGHCPIGVLSTGQLVGKHAIPGRSEGQVG